ncbi:hypothetical protein FRAAL2409 [Frankia alni ACN14a]|uniref:Uncharacterized protein n=1 Tax=Frankia alni (strain DSM 45986 / CECT 9034 / ACN14a) TaxID=326424 RepID=Q0RN35_FRAAA|nr:hypothetical protein FRAAL2409 [Frankia alni ACN14a]
MAHRGARPGDGCDRPGCCRGPRRVDRELTDRAARAANARPAPAAAAPAAAAPAVLPASLGSGHIAARSCRGFGTVFGPKTVLTPRLESVRF